MNLQRWQRNVLKAGSITLAKQSPQITRAEPHLLQLLGCQRKLNGVESIVDNARAYATRERRSDNNWSKADHVERFRRTVLTPHTITSCS